ncbi:hypothetical protein HaLaN_13751 [Haematococcus lacustris]|uniref:Uncharacterized protein n=1 Tax=Haematococcus lacustris TaxID=44745 RepID=A0A699ZDY6_HAELA|nr:hypothetical protein HaLaN_13751 [Haematococcus lacustris]
MFVLRQSVIKFSAFPVYGPLITSVTKSIKDTKSIQVTKSIPFAKISSGGKDCETVRKLLCFFLLAFVAKLMMGRYCTQGVVGAPATAAWSSPPRRSLCETQSTEAAWAAKTCVWKSRVPLDAQDIAQFTALASTALCTLPCQTA